MQLVNGNMESSPKDESFSSQLIISRYRNLGKEKFQGAINYEINPIEFIKECTTNYSINLPNELNEFLFTSDNIPLIWLSDLPVFSKINEFMRKEGIVKGDFTNSLGEIKKFFSKWLLTRSEKERQFFSTTTLNLIEKDVFRFNYQKYVYKALLIAFDKRVSNVEAAISSINSSIETITSFSLEDNVRIEIEYILYLTMGFICLRSGLPDDAVQAFANANSIKPNGVTGLLYQALSAKMMGDIPSAMEYLSNILTMDLKRFEYALRINKIEAYGFFLKNAYVYKIFTENKFADSIEEIESLLDSFFSREENIMYRISLMTSELEELRLSGFYNDDIKNQLRFIKEFVEKFRNSKSVLVLMTATMVREKFEAVANQILETIKTIKLNEMSKKLHVYDHQLKDVSHSVDNLKQSGGKKREKLNTQLGENVELLREEYKEKIKYAERLIKNLDSNSKFDTGSAFSTGMFYNFVISIFVFIIGGIGSGMLSGSSGFNMNQFMINGVKWGGVAFVLGMFAAVFSVFSTMSDKSNEKSRLHRFLESIKREEEAMLGQFKEENTERLKMFDESYKAELHKEETRLEKLRQEKEGKYRVFSERVENEMSTYRDQITKILSH